jgi:hypothetical protein
VNSSLPDQVDPGYKNTLFIVLNEEQRMHQITIAILTLIVTSTCFAEEVGGVTLDPKATLEGKELQLNGAGIRKKAFFKVYVASLYLTQKATDLRAVLQSHTRRIQLNLLRDLTTDQFRDALNDGLIANVTVDTRKQIQPQIGELTRIVTNCRVLNEKDVIILDYVDGMTRFTLNGKEQGVIPGELFNQCLMKIWMGDKPVQSDLKQAMLGR